VMVRAESLCVFVGAGASLSMPAGLPVFDWLRDDVLRQLRLSQYVPGARFDHDPLTEVAAGLVPEPFMLELSRSGIDVQAWLSRVLSRGRPNAAHHALAQLAAHGARIWTVNFDTLIEQASDQALGCIAWPRDPAAGAPVMKPHGSVGGSLIVTAAQVLVGLDERWLARLRADVQGRLAVFLGYRGRDLDFQPVWDEILDTASGVIWFERQVDGRPGRGGSQAAALAAREPAGRPALPSSGAVPAGYPGRRAAQPVLGLCRLVLGQRAG
jgi:SIR2-like domain